MVHKKFSINPIFSNCTNINSLSSMLQVEMKSKGGVAAILWFNFAASLSQSCASFMTSAVPIRYGCARCPCIESINVHN